MTGRAALIGLVVVTTFLPVDAALGAAGGLPGEIEVVRIADPAPGAELRVRGKPVARLFGTGARAQLQTAARRLRRALLTPVAVSVDDRGTTARLLVDGQMVLETREADAAREQTTPALLVDRWAAALREALAVAPIAVSPSQVVLSPGGVAYATVTAPTPGVIRLDGFDTRIAGVHFAKGALRVVGRRLGGTTVSVRLGPYQTSVAIAVRSPAGVIPVAAEVIVTGSPAPPELIREAVARRVRQVVRMEPGARTAVAAAPIDAPLAAGAALSVPVAVRITSPYAGPVDGSVQVSVTNAPIRLADPDRLLVSNRPETITADGLLFHETLTADHPARLLFHHLNGTASQSRILKISLSNPGGARARVHYTRGLAGPAPDPVLTGHQATARFLSALTAGVGYIVEVPPRGRAEFTAYTLAPQALVSGLMQLQVVEGGPIDLTVHVRLPWLLDRTVTTDLGPWAFPHPRGTFPGSLVDVKRDVPADQPAIIGDLGIMSELRDVRTGEPLVGDYGVLYRFRLRLVNPTDRQITAALLANAAGGPARGHFLIDGVVADLGLLQANEERMVTSFVLPPGSSRDVTVLTMPIAGSFYPVRLAMRPR
ncbi:MAG: hypothetical protein ACT4PY_13510 [Armatimonadota bacterium]